MLFPAQRRAAEDDAVLLGGCLQRLELAAGTHVGQRRAVALGGIAGGIEGKVQDAAWLWIGVNGAHGLRRGSPRARDAG